MPQNGLYCFKRVISLVLFASNIQRSWSQSHGRITRPRVTWVPVLSVLFELMPFGMNSFAELMLIGKGSFSKLVPIGMGSAPFGIAWHGYGQYCKFDTI